MRRLKGLAPIIDDKAKILILGSFPGPKSLEKRQYYAHPQNRFWEIIFNVLDRPLPAQYKDKTKLLKDMNVGLWDVIGSCRREGASDNNISNIELNDFAGFLKDNTNIKVIFTNGKKACELFKRYYKDIGVCVECLPSTSPANARHGYNYKKNKWKKILVHLHPPKNLL